MTYSMITSKKKSIIYQDKSKENQSNINNLLKV